MYRLIAITASFTAEPVGEPLSFVLGELGMKYRAVFAPYQQVFQQLLDPASLVRTADGFAVVLVRFEDWLHGDEGPSTTQEEKLEQVADDLIAALGAAQRGTAPLIVCFCPASRAVSEKRAGASLLRQPRSEVGRRSSETTARCRWCGAMKFSISIRLRNTKTNMPSAWATCRIQPISFRRWERCWRVASGEPRKTTIK